METTTPVHPYDGHVSSTELAGPSGTDPNPAAAEAAAQEATGKLRTLTFGEGDGAITVDLPRKWKRFKFMRALARNDVYAGLEAIWPPTPALGGDGKQLRDVATGELLWDPHPTVLLLEEAEISGDEFAQAMETLGAAVSGISPGNSAASPS